MTSSKRKCFYQIVRTSIHETFSSIFPIQRTFFNKATKALSKGSSLGRTSDDNDDNHDSRKKRHCDPEAAKEYKKNQQRKRASVTTYDNLQLNSNIVDATRRALRESM